MNYNSIETQGEEMLLVDLFAHYKYYPQFFKYLMFTPQSAQYKHVQYIEKSINMGLFDYRR